MSSPGFPSAIPILTVRVNGFTVDGDPLAEAGLEFGGQHFGIVDRNGPAGMTTNSSPPSRAITQWSSVPSRIRSAKVRMNLVTGAVPEVVVHCFQAVQIEEQHAHRAGLAGSEPLVEVGQACAPVEQTGWVVVFGEVAGDALRHRPGLASTRRARRCP